jgi:hypothetical protein
VSPSPPRARWIVLACAGIGLAGLWGTRRLAESAQRTPGNKGIAETTRASGGRASSTLPPRDAGRAALRREDAALAPGLGPVREEATLGGRILLDGAPAAGGRVVARAEAGGWERATQVDPSGRFWLGAVPAAALELAFELPSPSERELLLARVGLTPVAGSNEDRLFDWRSVQLNLRVLGAAAGSAGASASLRIEGPRLAARLETDARGKANLSIVADGVLRFEAVRADGSRGEAALDLATIDDLDSLVIHAARESRSPRTAPPPTGLPPR